MSDEQDKLKVSLEPPKLFGRKKKSDAPASKRSSSAPTDGVEEPPADEAAADDVETPDEVAPVADEVAPVADEVEPGTGTSDVEPAADETAVIEPAADETAVIEPVAGEPSDDTAVIDVPVEAEPAAEAPAVAPAPAAVAAKAPQKATRPAPAKKTAAAAAPAPEIADKPADKRASKPAAAVAKKATRPRAKLAPPIEPEPVTSTDLEDAAIVEHDEGPLLAMYPAAAVTGVVVGGVMVLLTWLSLRGCEAVRGTSSCGGGPGFVLLVATFVLCILLGSTLLKTFAIPDPGSSSFLAVGLVAVVALLFLIDALDNWSMIIVIPVLAVGAYLASVWVTRTFVEPTDIDAS